MGRKINDGDKTGLKQDRFRHSRFEVERDNLFDKYQGVSKKSINTIGGSYQASRGQKNDESISQAYRNHGGSLIGHDRGHYGSGPKGYKRSDESIFEDVCDMLTKNPYVDASDIVINVNEGIVYLNGLVTDRQSKKMAEFAIENVSGVVDVQNL